MGGIILLSLLGLGLTSLILSDDDQDSADANDQITDDDQMTLGTEEDNFLYSEDARAYLEENGIVNDENADNAVFLEGPLNVDTGAGNDVVFGSASNDFIRVGAGEDYISSGNGNDALFGGLQNDELHGNAGEDTILGGFGRDLIIGGDDDDLIRGGHGDDELRGDDGAGSRFAGNDTIFGDEGDDILFGALGADMLHGGDGNDRIDGRDDGIADGLLGPTDNDESDEIYGDNGNDVLTLGQNDIAFGGNGSDTFQVGQWITADNQAEIRDFDSTDDKIEVVYDQDLEEEPIVTIETSRVTDDALILIDGVVVANVIGAKNLISVSDVLISQEEFG